MFREMEIAYWAALNSEKEVKKLIEEADKSALE